MKRIFFFILSGCCFTFTFGAQAETIEANAFSESVLIDAFEKGRSLASIEVLSTTKDFYKIRVIQPIILGDLTANDLRGPLELYAGVSYGDVLKSGFAYALFITKDCPYLFSWCHRDDVIKVDLSGRKSLQALIEAANRAYEKTSIREFREKKIKEKAKLPALSGKIISLCESFKSNPVNRAEFAKAIFESELGSRFDESELSSSQILYSPPKIPLSREQMISLFGKPILKCGWTYKWFCGRDKNVADPEKYVGILSVTFDKSEDGIRVLYYSQKREKWARYSEKDPNSAKLSKEAETTMSQFQEAIRNSDWDRAIGFCSDSVKSKASDYNSTEVFFRDVVPVDEIVSLSQYQTSGGTYNREGQQVEFHCFLRVPVKNSEETVDWIWTVGKTDGGWLIDFETIGLKRHIENKRLRLLQGKQKAQEKLEQFQGGLKTRLIPLSNEFVVGKPMLFRVEITNTSESPITYAATSIMVNDPLSIKGPDGNVIEYVDTSYQTAVQDKVIKSGQTVILADNYDATSQYCIIKPGQYTFQLKGRHYECVNSNIIEVEVKPGELTPADSIVQNLLTILPKGWTCTRELMSREPSAENPSSTFISVWLIGKSGQKGISRGIDVDIRIYLTKDEIVPESDQFGGNLWGRCKFGPVYVKAYDAALLWPDYEEQIIKALNIEQVKSN